MQGSISLRTGAQTRFMGQAEPRLGRARISLGDSLPKARISLGDSQTCSAWGLILLSAPQPGQAAKGTLAEHETVEDKQQVQSSDRTEHITFNHINGCHSQKLSLLQGLRRWWSVKYSQSNPKSAWKRQHSRVRACDQRDNAGRHWCERALLKARCRNSHCEGLNHFLWEMGFDLTKDEAHRAPCELLRQLIYQSHLKYLKHLTIQLFVMLNLISQCELHKNCWNWDILKSSHTETVLIVGKLENKKCTPLLCLVRHSSTDQDTKEGNICSEKGPLTLHYWTVLSEVSGEVIFWRIYSNLKVIPWLVSRQEACWAEVRIPPFQSVNHWFLMTSLSESLSWWASGVTVCKYNQYLGQWWFSEKSV